MTAAQLNWLRNDTAHPALRLEPSSHIMSPVIAEVSSVSESNIHMPRINFPKTRSAGWLGRHRTTLSVVPDATLCPPHACLCSPRPHLVPCRCSQGGCLGFLLFWA